MMSATSQVDKASRELRSRIAQLLERNPQAYGTVSLKLTIQGGKIVLLETAHTETEKL